MTRAPVRMRVLALVISTGGDKVVEAKSPSPMACAGASS